MKVRVKILDSYDGFDILVEQDGSKFQWHFDQEDTRENLVKVFEKLGIEASYKEVY